MPPLARRARFVWLLLAAQTGAAFADPLAAIVEDVDSGVASVGFMDYLERGRTVDLGAKGWIEIGYFASCTHEKITGGVVRIGAEHSEVTGGRVERRQVQCDTEHLSLTKSVAARAAGSAQRSADKSQKSLHPVTGAELMLYGAAPLVVAFGPGEVAIVRVADERNRQTVTLALDKGRGVYDFARNGLALQPGAAYRASYGNRSIVFRIDRDASVGGTDVLGRLILFPPERP